MKKVIRRTLQKFGYDINRYKKDEYPERRDPFLQQKLLCQNRSKVIIFDVGAHVGTITALYRQLFPNAEIYAFEPFQESFKKLQAASAHDRLVHAIELGLSDNAGTVRLNVNKSEMTNSLLETTKSAKSFWGGDILDAVGHCNIEVTTIDAFCRHNAIEKIDILKIDAQGLEERILAGAASMLGEKKISYIYAEMILVPTYEGQGKFHEVLSLLDGLGYSLFSVYNFDYRPSSNRLLQLDAIFFENGLQR
jgi:FkbM family methyltransferase